MSTGLAEKAGHSSLRCSTPQSSHPLRLKISLSSSASRRAPAASASSHTDGDDGSSGSRSSSCSSSTAADDGGARLSRSVYSCDTPGTDSAVAQRSNSLDRSSPNTSAKLTGSNLYIVLSHIHSQLMRRDQRGIFANPVTDDIAIGYSQVISHPMDMGTIGKRLESRIHYASITCYLADVRLMCNNAMVYNPPDTIYYQRARKLQQFCKKLLSPRSSLHKLLNSLGLPDDALSQSEIGDLSEETALLGASRLPSFPTHTRRHGDGVLPSLLSIGSIPASTSLSRPWFEPTPRRNRGRPPAKRLSLSPLGNDFSAAPAATTPVSAGLLLSASDGGHSSAEGSVSQRQQQVVAPATTTTNGEKTTVSKSLVVIASCCLAPTTIAATADPPTVPLSSLSKVTGAPSSRPRPRGRPRKLHHVPRCPAHSLRTTSPPASAPPSSPAAPTAQLVALPISSGAQSPVASSISSRSSASVTSSGLVSVAAAAVGRCDLAAEKPLQESALTTTAVTSSLPDWGTGAAIGTGSMSSSAGGLDTVRDGCATGLWEEGQRRGDVLLQPVGSRLRATVDQNKRETPDANQDQAAQKETTPEGEPPVRSLSARATRASASDSVGCRATRCSRQVTVPPRKATTTTSRKPCPSKVALAATAPAGSDLTSRLAEAVRRTTKRFLPAATATTVVPVPRHAQKRARLCGPAGVKPAGSGGSSRSSSSTPSGKPKPVQVRVSPAPTPAPALRAPSSPLCSSSESNLSYPSLVVLEPLDMVPLQAKEAAEAANLRLMQKSSCDVDGAAEPQRPVRIGPRIVYLDCSRRAGEITAVDCPQAQSTWSQGHHPRQAANGDSARQLIPTNTPVNYPPAVVRCLATGQRASMAGGSDRMADGRQKGGAGGRNCEAEEVKAGATAGGVDTPEAASEQPSAKLPLLEPCSVDELEVLKGLDKLKYSIDEPISAGIHGPLAIFSPEEMAQLAEVYGTDLCVIEYAYSLLTFVEPVGRLARRWASRRLDLATDGLHGQLVTGKGKEAGWPGIAGLTVDPVSPPSAVGSPDRPASPQAEVGVDDRPDETAAGSLLHLLSDSDEDGLSTVTVKPVPETEQMPTSDESRRLSPSSVAGGTRSTLAVGSVVTSSSSATSLLKSALNAPGLCPALLSRQPMESSRSASLPLLQRQNNVPVESGPAQADHPLVSQQLRGDTATDSYNRVVTSGDGDVQLVPTEQVERGVSSPSGVGLSPLPPAEKQDNVQMGESTSSPPGDYAQQEQAAVAAEEESVEEGVTTTGSGSPREDAPPTASGQPETLLACFPADGDLGSSGRPMDSQKCLHLVLRLDVDVLCPSEENAPAGDSHDTLGEPTSDTSRQHQPESMNLDTEVKSEPVAPSNECLVVNEGLPGTQASSVGSPGELVGSISEALEQQTRRKAAIEEMLDATCSPQVPPGWTTTYSPESEPADKAPLTESPAAEAAAAQAEPMDLDQSTTSLSESPELGAAATACGPESTGSPPASCATSLPSDEHCQVVRAPTPDCQSNDSSDESLSGLVAESPTGLPSTVSRSPSVSCAAVVVAWVNEVSSAPEDALLATTTLQGTRTWQQVLPDRYNAGLVVPLVGYDLSPGNDSSDDREDEADVLAS